MSNSVPDGWQYNFIGDIATVFAGGTPSRANTEYYVGSNPWVKSGEVNARQIFNTEEHISDLAIIESSAKWAKAGSVLVAMYGATAGQVAKLMIDATLNQAVSAINGKDDLAHNLTKGIGHTEFKDSPVGRIPVEWEVKTCLLYTSPSPRDVHKSRMPSSA